MLASLINNFTSRGKSSGKANFIFYKIVDSLEENKYVLQCKNTKAIINLKLEEIVFDLDILHRLHPAQSCYIGIEYSKYIKFLSSQVEIQKRNKEKFRTHDIFRYGNYRLISQDRQGDICFLNVKTNEEFIMDPRDIALSEELINEFDAAQSFYIGLLTGLRLNNKTIKKENPINHNKLPPHWTVK